MAENFEYQEYEDLHHLGREVFMLAEHDQKLSYLAANSNLIPAYLVPSAGNARGFPSVYLNHSLPSNITPGVL